VSAKPGEVREARKLFLAIQLTQKPGEPKLNLLARKAGENFCCLIRVVIDPHREPVVHGTNDATSREILGDGDVAIHDGLPLVRERIRQLRERAGVRQLEDECQLLPPELEGFRLRSKLSQRSWERERVLNDELLGPAGPDVEVPLPIRNRARYEADEFRPLDTVRVGVLGNHPLVWIADPHAGLSGRRIARRPALDSTGALDPDPRRWCVAEPFVLARSSTRGAYRFGCGQPSTQRFTIRPVAIDDYDFTPEDVKSRLHELFEAAEAKDEFEFGCTLLRVRGKRGVGSVRRDAPARR
jgi:hypothetical protein